MFAIVKDNEIIGLCEHPRYIKKHNNVFIEVSEAEAEGVAIGGVAYSLNGGIPEAEPVVIKELDGAEYIFQERIRLSKTEDAIASIEDALCDLSKEA